MTKPDPVKTPEGYDVIIAEIESASRALIAAYARLGIAELAESFSASEFNYNVDARRSLRDFIGLAIEESVPDDLIAALDAVYPTL